MKAKRISIEEDLQIAFQIRKEVFVEEQGVPLEDEFDEFDTLDGQCKHIIVFYDQRPVGTGRIRSLDGFGKLERICVLKPYRKFGLGKVIINTLEEIAKEMGLSKVKLHGQTQAEGFYKKLGYQTLSDTFMEDGIPHVLMVKEFV
ncbi:GNAT family N-acetyltransferase [Calidifontibacillus erzurumensis]|uniref:GNAT family N-acetyltransferase n=1 Tax=Calidifontibacillus erzurumensis TaxID=2741433 RepID=A0A8J8K7J3_9BACI|nr:GNAT family N-acetyltransferase [Calidifontibacillus erzurumensis]NSL50811.1 GNAT family N-acetyltransferase [Calidifontibacillus erzurumensis]